MAPPNKDNSNILSQIFISIEQHNIETEKLFNELQESKVNVDYNTIKLDDEVKTKLSASTAVDNTDKKEVFKELQSYFNNNYSQNTKMRVSYHDKIVELDKILDIQKKDVAELKNENDSLIQKSDTNSRKLVDEKIILKNIRKRNNIHYSIFITMILITCILLLVILDILPKNTGIVISLIIIILLILYVLYRSFLTELNKDKNSTDGIIVSKGKLNNYKSVCAPNIDREKEKNKELQKKLDDVLQSAKQNCPSTTKSYKQN